MFGLPTFFASKNAGAVDADTLRSVAASDSPDVTTLGATTDAAIVTDANGSISSKLRGLVKILADVWNSTTHLLGVAATLAAETTKVIGTVNLAANQTLATLTSITNAVTVQKAAVTEVISTALEASHVLKNAAGSLVLLMVTSTKTSAQWILVMDSATVPGDGAVTLLLPPIAIGPSETILLQFDKPVAASAGVSVCNSSTGTFTKTLGAADCVFKAQVI